MAFAMPPKVVWTKTVNGNNVRINLQVQDNNNVNIGAAVDVDFDMTVTPPLVAWATLLRAAVWQVSQRLAWTDMPASGTLSIPTVDTIQSSDA